MCISYNSGDILVLHEEDGVVYGYGDAFRGMNPIYINGTAEGSGSASTWYLYGNYSFEGNVYSSPVLLSVEYRAKEEEPNYYKNGYPSEGTQITKEEYEQLREEYKAEKAKDYSLTIENILKYVP